MITLYKHKTGLSPPEFFRDNRFDLNLECNRLILRVMERAQYLGSDEILTPYGKGSVRDLCDITKLALCLVNYPCFTFRAKNIRDKDLELILNLPDGFLALDLSAPISYYFPVKVKTNNGCVFDSSTDVNLWYFNNYKDMVYR